MFKAVIFDLDGVILDSMPFHVRSWKEAFARYGYKVRAKDLYLNEGAVEADGTEQLIYEGEKSLSAERFNSILRLQQDIFCSRYAVKVKTFSSWKSSEGFLLTR
jgi:beta-phosphoglucomutase